MSPRIGAPFARAISDRPSSRRPVPASRIMSHPLVVRTSTHGVLPPYRTVVGPGLGIEPRVPQNCTRKLIPRCLGALALTVGDAAELGKERCHGCLVTIVTCES